MQTNTTIRLHKGFLIAAAGFNMLQVFKHGYLHLLSYLLQWLYLIAPAHCSQTYFICYRRCVYALYILLFVFNLELELRGGLLYPRDPVSVKWRKACIVMLAPREGYKRWCFNSTLEVSQVNTRYSAAWLKLSTSWEKYISVVLACTANSGISFQKHKRFNWLCRKPETERQMDKRPINCTK